MSIHYGQSRLDFHRSLESIHFKTLRQLKTKPYRISVIEKTEVFENADVIHITKTIGFPDPALPPIFSR